jgi:hypothetical protein
MTIQAPTRFMIEIHPPDPAAELPSEGGSPVMPIVRVVHEPVGARPPSVIAAEPREHVPAPAAYEPGPCLCLDDDDCAADHANE